MLRYYGWGRVMLGRRRSGSCNRSGLGRRRPVELSGGRPLHLDNQRAAHDGEQVKLRTLPTVPVSPARLVRSS
jgi:hypothetical protein